MKRNLTIITILFGLSLGSLWGLAPASRAQTGEELATAQAKFGFTLFNQLLEEKDQNLFISPASIAFALTMTYNGAAGETQRAMAQTLGIQGLSLEKINQENGRLRKALSTSDPKIRLHLANSLWLDRGMEFKPEFLQANQQFYQAALKILNLNDSKAGAAAINNWVARETEGKISQIVDDVTPPLVLVNAIYFKGIWKQAFNKTETKEQPFTLVNGKQKQMPMMSQSGSYKYYQGENFQAVNLPYGKDQRFGMKIFLPTPNSNLKEFLKELNADNWRRWVAAMQPTEGRITMPRFTLEYDASLKKPLKALGMAVAFDDQKADFRNLCSQPAYIDDVIHKAFMEVNEEGTEAAAATAVKMKLTSSIEPVIPKRFTMMVDRPFFVVIDDNETGALLFMGAVFEPK